MDSTASTIVGVDPPHVPGPNMDEHASEQVRKKKPPKTGRETQPGIIYLSRIPAFMKPKRIQHIFGQYGELGRTFLQPEDKYTRHTRKKKGGNKARCFSEGWVEFKDKKIAKRVALTLNNTRVSGRKRSRYYDDLWSIKYLHRFQWAHLAGQLEYEQQVQKQRMRAEIVQAKRETSVFLKNVEKSQWLGRMESKKRKQGKEWTHRIHQYKQHPVGDVKSRSGKVSGSLLGKIFAKADTDSSDRH
ncbi:activator of basal transcription 1-like [Acanthaster planci]|uniref:Activator of basal transcription 1 n=1 Tax=Acanthaster planci TaxID=133434 RepID=A0A8B7ZFE9_ACAPL|nr:activator of basal transcription 1-like [Acanthaster planci]XP_022103585.1 activator of basal transcription 1-like [Acanthaster planci]